MLEIRGIWLCHMCRWDRYVLRPRVRAETSGSETVPHIGPYIIPFKTLGSRVCGVWTRYNALLASYCLDSDLSLGIPVVPLVLRTPVNILVIRLTSVLCLVSSLL